MQAGRRGGGGGGSGILDRSLEANSKEVSLSSFSFLFSEMVQYCRDRAEQLSDLERKLEELGYRVGGRSLELCTYRDKPGRRETKVREICSEETTRVQRHYAACSMQHAGTGCSMLALVVVVPLRHGDTSHTIVGAQMLGILTFIQTSVWTSLFGKPADDIQKSVENEGEYYLIDNLPLVNQFISVPDDMGQFNCGDRR